jgi:hypothetical protein
MCMFPFSLVPPRGPCWPPVDLILDLLCDRRTVGSPVSGTARSAHSRCSRRHRRRGSLSPGVCQEQPVEGPVNCLTFFGNLTVHLRAHNLVDDSIGRGDKVVFRRLYCVESSWSPAQLSEQRPDVMDLLVIMA